MKTKNQHAKRHQKLRVNIEQTFTIFARKSSELVGRAWVFALTCAIVLIWAIMGPFFHFSDTWQLIMNTTSSVLTLLVAFVIQNSLNRDTDMVKIKLDELIKSHESARNTRLNLDDLTDEELKTILEKYKKLGKNEQLVKKDKNPSTKKP